MLPNGKPWDIPGRGGAGSRWGGGEAACGAGGVRDAPPGSSLGRRPWAAVSAGEGLGLRGEGWRLQCPLSVKQKFLRYRLKGWQAGRGRAAPLLSWKLWGSSVFSQEGPSRPGPCEGSGGRAGRPGDGACLRNCSAARPKPGARCWRGCGAPEGCRGRVARSRGGRRWEECLAPLPRWRPPGCPGGSGVQ